MNIEKEKELNLLKIRKKKRAEFVPVEEIQNNKFKYLSRLLKIEKISQWLIELKRSSNSKIQGIQLLLSKIDWKSVFKDSAIWIIEAFIEGLTINFATHFIFGLKMTPMTILGYGIIIKQGIDIYWRLRNNGPNTKILKKDK